MATPLQSIHVNDIGTVFTLTVRDGLSIVDLSAADTASENFLVFLPPSGAAAKQRDTDSLPAADGKLIYTTVSGDIDEVGEWRVQGQFTLPNSPDVTFRTSVHKFNVLPNLT